MSRDNFTNRTKKILSERVGGLCSNPACSSPCYGPNSVPSKSSIIGVAAHISAAAEGGPRFNSELTPEERSDISNGIWLCQNCAHLIDNDEIYTTEELLRWKNKAEDRAKKAITTGKIVTTDLSDTILIALRQERILWLNQLPSKPTKITLHPIKCNRNLINPQFPLFFDKNLDKYIQDNDLCMITLFSQNQGINIDENIRMRISFKDKAIKNIKIENKDRVEVIGGGGINASFAEFYIKNLLPNEMQLVNVFADKNISFDVDLWSSGTLGTNESSIFDLIIGEN